MIEKYLGCKIKSDEIISLFDDYSFGDIVYEIDRMHENSDDVYWCSSHENGILIRFNDHQIADVIFLYVMANDDYNICDLSLLSHKVFGGFNEAVDFCYNKSIKFEARNNVEGFGKMLSWVKLYYENYTMHYEFDNTGLRIITLSLIKSAQQADAPEPLTRPGDP